MSTVIIKGENKLNGKISVSGSKNSALPILIATLMLEGQSVIRNVPNLVDINTVIRLIRALGVRAEYLDDVVKVWNYNKIRHIAPYELITKMRASFLAAGPVLAKTGLAKIPLPGGCAIGARPVDIHIKGLEQLGAKVTQEHGMVIMEAKKLKGSDIYLSFPSVGATETIMMAACLAKGKTVLDNAANEPEIPDLANFLIAGGAKITGAGTSTIEIEGVDGLHEVDYDVIPDRIEAGTFIIAAAMIGGEVLVENIVPQHLDSLFRVLKEMGLDLTITDHAVLVKTLDRLKAIDIETAPYPGFPTDLQAQLSSLLTICRGTSVVTESIFENRFMHVSELVRMGARIKVKDRNLIIEGVKSLSGAPVQCPDLRAGAALWLAGLAAGGETTIYGNQHVYRGYERLIEKLTALGADIRKIN